MSPQLEIKSVSGIDLPVEFMEYLSASPAVFKSVCLFENSKEDFLLSTIEQKAIEITVCETLDDQYWIDYQMKSALSKGMSLAEILQIRIGLSNKKRIEVLLEAAKSIVINYQNINEQMLNVFVSEGLSENELLEVVSLVNQQKMRIQLTHYWLIKNSLQTRH
jgi:hypothetical protein